MSNGCGSNMDKHTLFKFEEEIKEIYLAGRIRAPVHLAGGNEDALIEIFKEMGRDDWCFSTYRSHLHALLKGIDREWLKQEILAGRSMHINSKEHRFFTSSIAGGCLPIALGVAMAIKMKGEDRKVWCFVGDMAAEMGIFHECSKYAMNHNLPIVFCVEDNSFSVDTPTAEVWGIKENPSEEGKVEVVKSWQKGKIIRFRYSRTYPHSGIGIWLDFTWR